MLLSCRRVLLTALVALVGSSFAAADEGAALKIKKGDRIVFLGDSITQAGNDHATGYVVLVRKAFEEKYGKDVEVIGAGISGNKVPDIQKRLQRDVLSHKPTLVVIYIGINDVWHGESDPKRGTLPEAYREGLEDVITRITDAGARVLLCTPSVIGEKADGSNKNDRRLDEYAGISRSVAKKLKVPVCDLRRSFIEKLKKDNIDNKERGVLTPDGVHLNDTGNAFVAKVILESLGE
jgi:lysophospholipase L1-like esterase